MESLLSVLKPQELLSLKLRALYEENGYKQYVMSRFEEYAFYLENRDFLVSDTVITFTDLDGRLLALKPDVTLSIAKRFTGKTEKLYYTENVYRPDNTNRSFKEIQQIGLERLGEIDDFAVANVVGLAAKSLKLISEKSLLEIGHCGFVNGLINHISDDKSVRKTIVNLLTQKNAYAIKKMHCTIPIEKDKIDALIGVLDLNGSYDTVITKAKQFCFNNEMLRAVNDLERLIGALNREDGLCSLSLDLSMCGEEEYYNGVVFSGYVYGLPSRVLSGGRYDALLKKLGKGGEALGFALYLDELNFLL